MILVWIFLSNPIFISSFGGIPHRDSFPAIQLLMQAEIS
uniref:Uncharacterized protein n=1 Tax=Moniliophthora roreri TaxID=221103 RepID=A0A0W0GCR3_MONRR